jgi:hypothetical protein
MRSKHAHPTLDYLVDSAPVDVVVYVLTEKGSAALAK